MELRAAFSLRILACLWIVRSHLGSCLMRELYWRDAQYA